MLPPRERRAPRAARSYAAFYPGVCVKCDGIFEKDALIALSCTSPDGQRHGKGHADCAAAPGFNRTGAINGVTQWTRADGSLAYIERAGRVYAATKEDVQLAQDAAAGKLREAEPMEREGIARWRQVCRVCDGIIDVGERQFWRPKENGPKQKARHMRRCSPAEWRIEKNAAGTFWQDLRPGHEAGVYHLAKGKRTDIERVGTVNAAEAEEFARQSERADMRVDGAVVLGLARIEVDAKNGAAEIAKAAKFADETVEEPRIPDVDG